MKNMPAGAASASSPHGNPVPSGSLPAAPPAPSVDSPSTPPPVAPKPGRSLRFSVSPRRAQGRRGNRRPLRQPHESLLGGRVLAWSLWDWGAAAFNSVATTFVFSVYLTEPDLFAPGDTPTQVLSLGLALAGFVVAFFAPVSGQKADHKGRGTRMLGVFSGLVAFSILGMYFVYPTSPLGSYGALLLGVALLGLGNIFYEFATVNYNAMLSRIATPKNMGKISGLGWGMGYLGGIVLMVIVYFGLIAPEVGWFGVSDENYLNIRATMLVAALWFMVFTLPVLFALPGRRVSSDGVLRTLTVGGFYEEEGDEEPKAWFVALADAYRQLWATVKRIRRHSPSVFRFMLASAVFRDGLAGVFTYGAILASTVFGLGKSEVLVFAIVANVVAGVATVLCGLFDDIFGPRAVMIISLASMSVCALVLFGFPLLVPDFVAARGPLIFWSFGLVMCVFVGPTQSASRSYLARLIPSGREGEIFGLYATSGRAISFLAPLFFAFFVWVGAFLVADAQYWGILGILALLAGGLGMLLRVDAVSPTAPQKGF